MASFYIHVVVTSAVFGVSLSALSTEFWPPDRLTAAYEYGIPTRENVSNHFRFDVAFDFSNFPSNSLLYSPRRHLLLCEFHSWVLEFRWIWAVLMPFFLIVGSPSPYFNERMLFIAVVVRYVGIFAALATIKCDFTIVTFGLSTAKSLASNQSPWEQQLVLTLLCDS